MTARRVFRNGAWQPATPITKPRQLSEPAPASFVSIAEQYAHLLDAISERLARAPHSCAALYDLEYVTDLPCLRCDLERLLESEPK